MILNFFIGVRQYGILNYCNIFLSNMEGFWSILIEGNVVMIYLFKNIRLVIVLGVIVLYESNDLQLGY